MDRGGVLEGKNSNLNYHGPVYVRFRENNIIERWDGESCVNYRVLLQLVSGSSSGHIGYIVGTTTWKFPWVLMYSLAARSLPPGDDKNSGKILCLVLVGREGRGCEWIGT